MRCFVLLSLIFSVSRGVPLGAEHKWENFKLSHNRIYENQDEEDHRFKIFADNVKYIEEHNKKYKSGEADWYMGVNHFSDMTSEEFLEYINNSDLPTSLNGTATKLFKPSSLRDYPEYLDMRSHLNRVRNQGSCGCCYAFATVCAVEAGYTIKNRKRAVLSPQNIVDCSSPYGNHGCHGGGLTSSLAYIKEKGIMTEDDYPFTGNEEKCKFDSSKSVLQLTGFVEVTNKEKSIVAALNEKGVLAVAVDAKEWQHYEGGVFTPSTEFSAVNHAVVLAGYGKTDYTYTNYWLIRNSWGKWWGEDGNIRLARNIKDNYHVGLGAGNIPRNIPPAYPDV